MYEEGLCLSGYWRVRLEGLLFLCTDGVLDLKRSLFLAVEALEDLAVDAYDFDL